MIDRNSIKNVLSGLSPSTQEHRGGQKHYLAPHEWEEVDATKQRGVAWERIFESLASWTLEQGRAFYRDTKSFRQAFFRIKRRLRGHRS